MNNVLIVGAGSWGTALAILLSEKGIKTTLWTRREDTAEEMRQLRENRRYLPGFSLPEDLQITSDLNQAINGKDILLFAVPSHGMRHTAEMVAEKLLTEHSVRPTAMISASKGIENDSLMTMSMVFKDVFGAFSAKLISVLSGPSFAVEVAQKQPTAITLAVSDMDLGKRLQSLFLTDYFRVYLSEDIIGTELGGAVKNVLAIAAGISDGMGLGTNTRAALITRGLAEMSRLGVKMGANPITFSGLSGLGDLVLTCTGNLSRNRQVGLKLGQGQSIKEILNSMTMVAEGVKTAKSLFHISKKYDVTTPIIDQVYSVIYQDIKPEDAVKELMMRPPVHEIYGIEKR